MVKKEWRAWGMHLHLHSSGSPHRDHCSSDAVGVYAKQRHEPNFPLTSSLQSFKKPPPPSTISSEIEIPTADTSAADKSGRLQEAPTAADDHPADPASPAPRSIWNTLERYHSPRNCLPDYGNAKGSIMGNLVKNVKSLGSVFYGNNLSGNAPPARLGRPPTAKRVADDLLSSPPKRSRIDDGETRDVLSLDGNSDVVEVPPSRNGLATQESGKTQNNPSVRSSGDRQSQGSEVREYRSTSRAAGLGGSSNRSRGHRKKNNKDGQVQMPNGYPNRDQETTSGPHSFKRPARLHSSHEFHGDDIMDREEDDDDDDDDFQNFPAYSSKPRANGRGKRHYTNASFQLQDVSSGDELSQPHTDTKKLRDRMDPAGSIRRADNAFSLTKRTASSPDQLQSPRPSKRRSGRSDQGDISRTTFGSTASRRARLTVKKAVAQPFYIYPAREGMHESTAGATNEICSIVLSTDAESTSRFDAIDNQGKPLHELDWITPDFSKIRYIGWNSTSPVIHIKKPVDNTAAFQTGAALFLEFGSQKEADIYLDICQGACGTVRLDNVYGPDLLVRMDKLTKIVKSFNLKSLPLAADMQLAERQQLNEARFRRPNVESLRPQAQESSHFTQQRKARAQMRAKDGPASGPDTSQALTPTTPAEERRLREFVDEDGGGSGELLSRRSGSPLRIIHRETKATLQPMRTRRSAKPVERPSSPVLVKWTKVNPNWADNYKIPLIYERTTVNRVDIERLDEGEFLNDEIISFYAKYLHKELEEQDEQMAKKVYIFNSFFWEKLRAKGYEGVKSWTAKIDLLSFDYIVVPINQNAHWYLAVICNPGALLPRDDLTLDEDEPTVIERKAADVAEESKVSQLEELGVIDLENKPENGARKTKAKRGPGPRKYDPKDPRVITLDSLDGNHSNVATALKHYLKAEIRQRKGIDIDVPTPFGMAAKDIPFQTNFTDCGVYLLGYLEQFMTNPCEFTTHILQHQGRVWDVNAPALRNKIRDLIFGLHKSYQMAHMRAQRQKKLVKMGKSQAPVDTRSSLRVAGEQRVQQTLCPDAAKSQTPEARPFSRVASERPARRTSASTPPAASSLRAQSSPIRRGGRYQDLAQHNSISPPPRRRSLGSRFHAMKSSPSEKGEPEALDVNASMIVNPNNSVEMAEEATTEPEAEPEAMLLMVKSVEEVDHDQMEIPESPQLMDLVPPSSASRAASKGSSDRSFMRPDSTSERIFNSQHPETRSPYFTSSDVRPSNAKVRSPGPFHVVSSEDEHSQGKVRTSTKTKPKTRTKEKIRSGIAGATIDLTDE